MRVLRAAVEVASIASVRSSIHFTGAPTLRDAAAAMNSSA